MSNPYGGAPEPGEPSYQPYESSPYGGSSATPRGTDGVSIAGFVLSLLCCTSLIGLILGIVGIQRTKDGVRNGRWAAVSAIVVGAIGTLTFAGILGFFVWFGTSTVLLDSAEPGQCVDVDEFSDGNDATLFDKECSEPHEAEIVAADSFDRDQAAAFDPDDPAAVCTAEVEPEYSAAAESPDFELGIVFEARDPEAGDTFVCYLQRADGDELEESIAAN